MSKNRDYTGLVRTPSSMAWLIKKRSCVKGNLERLCKTQAELPGKIKALQEELDALDAVIPLHEVQVDPRVIKGRRPQRPAMAPHGELTRFLLNRLREADGQWLYTSELAAEFVRVQGIDLSKLRMADITDRVSKRLRMLQHAGDVRRHHDSSTQELGRWSLAAIDEA